MSGRIDDIDFKTLPEQRGILRQNGDSTLFFKFIGVHEPFDFILTTLQRTRLGQEFVNQRGLAVVDVRDDGDIAQGLGWIGHDGVQKKRALYP